MSVLNMSEVVQRSKTDTVKWIMIWGVLIAAVVANYYYATVPISIRLIGWLLLMLLVFGLIYQTQKGKTWWEFIEEAKKELKKVVWPTRQETIQTTTIVVLTVIISAVFLWLVDAALVEIIQFLTSK